MVDRLGHPAIIDRTKLIFLEFTRDKNRSTVIPDRDVMTDTLKL
ncbi:hypothetical protein V0288_14625 [Pannus brasiliensis CCIBt3594]|uniref:Uncharacterized protein n=1 Tax=Pannus brasiliensis CCIBt3594 TaxID=1427578 RepID=A0AAW9QKP2_9CHRO